MVKVAFFDTKEYDKKLFDEYNEKYGYEITYLESRLNSETAPLAKGFDAICIFVNDVVDEKTIKILKECGVKLIALRCAGFNNVDIKNLGDGLIVVRVPAYSPHAVAEHAVALLLSINRKIYKAYQRTKKYNFTLNGLLGFDIYGKHKKTGRKINEYGFDFRGHYLEEPDLHKGFKDVGIFDRRGFDIHGRNRYTAKYLDKEGYDRDGFYHELQEDGTYIKTDKIGASAREKLVEIDKYVFDKWVIHKVTK